MPQYGSVLSKIYRRFVLLAVAVVALDAYHQAAQAHQTNLPNSVCPGFVILANGLAVLSREDGPMGDQHGQAIRVQEGLLCVPPGHSTDTAWMATSHDTPATWFVMAASLRDELAHNSRANEGLSLTIVRPDGELSTEPLPVKLFVRMPHHDNRLPGGHGPANDPEVKGIIVEPDQQGYYIVPTIDFSMAGSWLFEVRVQQGSKLYKGYFAATVGEE